MERLCYVVEIDEDYPQIAPTLKFTKLLGEINSMTRNGPFTGVQLVVPPMAGSTRKMCIFSLELNIYSNFKDLRDWPKTD